MSMPVVFAHTRLVSQPVVPQLSGWHQHGFQRARDDAGILQKCAKPWGYHCVIDPHWTCAIYNNQSSDIHLGYTKELCARSIRDRKEIEKMGPQFDYHSTPC